MFNLTWIITWALPDFVGCLLHVVLGIAKYTPTFDIEPDMLE